MTTPKHKRRHLPLSINDILGGVLTAFIAVIGAISFARLIFSGQLEPYIAPGIGIGLFSCVIAGIILSLGTRYTFNIGGPRSPPAAIIAVVGSLMAATLLESNAQEKVFPTLVGFIGLATVKTGLFFILAGKLKLGKLIRYIPYPVIGGFIAGIGAVIIKRTFYTLTQTPLSLETFPTLFQAEHVVHWAPAMAWGGLIFGLSRKIKHFFLIPGMLIAAVIGFFILQFSIGHNLVTLQEGGWLLGNFSSGLLWPPLTPSNFTQIEWSLILDNWGNLAAIVIVSTFTLLMHSTAFEIMRNQNMNLNHELYVAGMANLGSGIGGGMICFPSLATNSLAYELKAISRSASFVFAGSCILFFFFAGSILSYVPNFVLGAMLFFQGFLFFISRLTEGWQNLPKTDYAIMLLITGTIVGVNFIAGILVGLVMFTLIFVLRYSSISIIKNELPGNVHHSNVMRDAEETAILEGKGHQIRLFQLTGYLFFGTANQLYERVMEYIDSPESQRLQYPIFDFSQVTGLDASAVFSFSKLLNQARKKKFIIVYTNLSPIVLKQLKVGDALCKKAISCRTFHDLDHALEFCENRILKQEGVKKKYLCDLPKPLSKKFTSDKDLQLFKTFLNEGAIEQGQYLFRQGDSEDGLYFIKKGLISVEIKQEKGSLRLQEMGPGSVVGEIALYTKVFRIADVKASKHLSYYHLSSENFYALQKEHPLIANAVHCFVVELLSKRLQQSNEQIQFLMQ